MLDQTLKAVERINISDIAQEKENLQIICEQLTAKKQELDKAEEDLQKEKQRERAKEKQKRDARRMPIRGPGIKPGKNAKVEEVASSQAALALTLKLSRENSKEKE